MYKINILIQRDNEYISSSYLSCLSLFILFILTRYSVETSRARLMKARTFSSSLRPGEISKELQASTA